MPKAFAGQQEGRRRIIPVAALLLCALLTASLGIWQIKRLAWKEALIAHVDAVTKAAPIAAATLPEAPGPQALTDLEYQPVRLSGQFDPQATTLVGALTELGGGYWEMVPLRMGNGRAIWVNRGFLPQGARRDTAMTAVPHGPVTLTGLLRASEVKPAFLRANHPEDDRWYTRNIAAIAAIAAKRQIAGSGTAWFVDAQGAAQPGQPTPGLTVIAFPNNHLQYALTWFALSAMCLFGIALVLRQRG
jgi:surfeit locus 1 family protein